VSGAPLANKTGHSGRSRAAAHDQALKHGTPADDPDFLIINLDLIDHGPDISPPKWRFAGENIRLHDIDEFRDFFLRDPRLGMRLSECAVERDLRNISLILHSRDALFKRRVGCFR